MKKRGTCVCARECKRGIASRRRSQAALEYILVHGWSIFIIILAIGVLSSFLFLNNSYVYSVADSIKQQASSISGKALFSQDIIEIPEKISQNSNLQVLINPGSNGIYKFAYIYDSGDNLKQVFSFDCEDICKKKKTADVFINDSYLGNYYVAVFDYNSDSYVKRSFEVVSEGEISKECTLKRAYWEKEQANDNQNVNLILESENCEGKQAVFSVYRDDWIFDNFIENISAMISGERTSVSWKAEWENSALIPFLWESNPIYSFKVKVNPEIESENELVVLEGEIFEGTEEGFKDEGWYSWAKDSHNSRIADDAVVPPFTLKWTARYPNSDKNFYLHLTRLLYQDNRLFVVMARHQMSNQGAGVAAYNATTGNLLWKRTIGGVKGNIGLFVLSNGYVWGGLDHNGQFSANMETGESAGGGARDSYANADESGVYSNGIPCTDCTTIKLEPLIPIFKPRYQIVNDSMFGNSVKFPPYPGYNFQSRDYLNVGNELNPGSSNWTAMLWFKWDDSAGDNSLFVKGENSDYYNTIYRVGINGGKVYYTLKSDEAYSAGKQYGAGSFNCSANEWCHFALTYDHQYQRMYKNGQLVFEQNRTGDIGSNNKSVYIGGFREISSFGGVIDEFAMFNRALSEEEIQEKMNSEIIPDSSTQVLLHFNNDSAQGENDEFFHDYSENGNNAFYNGHLNFYAPWSYSITNGNTGVPYSWYGGDGGLGQLALHEGVLYLPDGILWARNTSNGSVIWKQGVWPYQDKLGEIMHYTGVTYSEGVVYTFGKRCLKAHEGEINVYPGYVASQWDAPCLYGYNATTGQMLHEVCFNMSSYAKNAYYYSPGRIFQTIIEDDIAYISTAEQIIAINILSKQKIWEYNRPVRLDSHGWYDIQMDPTDIGDIVLSGNYLFGLEHFGDGLFVFDKNTGEIVWTFKSDDGDRLTGLAIVENMVFVSGEHGKIYALEQGYNQPEIINQETELPVAQENMEYAYINYQTGNTPKAVFKVKGGQWSFNWEISEGRLPNGLVLVNDNESYNSMIIGTPTESGDFTFTFRVTDARGNSDEKEFNLRVLPDSKEFSIILQDNENYSGCEDSYIYGHSAYVNKNFGNASILSLYQPNVNKRVLIRFKIFQSEGGPVPDDAIITSAQMTLTKTTAVSRTGKIYNLLRTWEENLVTWNNTRFNETWEVPGASEIDIDRSDFFVNFSMYGTKTVIYGKVIDNYADTFDVKKLFDGITPENNNGFLFEIDSNYVDMYSSDYINASEAGNGTGKRPRLILKYKRFNPENKMPVVKVYANPGIVPGFTWPSVPNVFLNANVYDIDGSITEYGTWPSSLLGFTGCTGLNLSTPWLCNGGVFLGIAYECINYCNITNSKYNEITCNTGVCGTPNKTLEIGFYAYDDIGTKGTGSAEIFVVRSLDGKFPYFLITTTMLRDGRVNQAYSDYVYVGGNTTLVSWSLASGNLPAGLNLNINTGEISGIPTLVGIYNFMISVGGVSQNLSIEVLDSSGIPVECSDGTAYGSCSSTKPKYCNNGTLIDNCSLCGCNAGGNCLANESCMPIEPQFINSCQNLSQEGRTYVLSADPPSSSVNCFIVTANNITLDLNGHVISGTGVAGMVVVGYNGTTIKNGRIKDFIYGIYFENNQNNNIINITRDKQLYGISLMSSSNNRIINNNFDSNMEYGIRIESGSNNRVENNNASSCKNMDCAGIHVLSSSNNILNNNTANSCSGPNNCAGIHLKSGSNNILSDNLVKNNYYHGIYIEYGSNNSIINNQAYSNDIGIHAESSSNNSFKNNSLVDNEMGIVDVLGKDNFYSGNYFNNKDYALLSPTKDMSLAKNKPISFNISVFYPNEIPCSQVNVNNITLYPSEGILYTSNENKIITSFTPSRNGLYSVLVNITDNSGNIIINRFYFGEQSSIGYYFREGGSSHDIGYLLFEPPVSEEIIWCAKWIEFSPQEIPDVKGISRITNVDAYFWHKGNLIYYGSNKMGGTRLNQIKYLPSSFDYIKSPVSLYPSIWLYNPLEWKNVFLKLYGGGPALLTNSSDPAFVNISYIYNTLIKEITNKLIGLLSATIKSENSAEIILGGNGTTDIIIKMPNSTILYNVSYDSIPCLSNSKCKMNYQKDGEINLTLISSSKHLLEVYSEEKQIFPCILTDASWNKTSAVTNELVELRVSGASCAGKEINYTIWKNIPFWFDKKVFQTSSAGYTSWNAGKKSDGSFETGDYYFIAELSSDSSVSVNSHSSGDLIVKIACVDVDVDGYNVTGGDCGSVDCNDNNKNVWQNLQGYLDSDGDGFGIGNLINVCSGKTLASGYAGVNGDCNDGNVNVHQGAAEICNGVDDNCVNGIDENNGDCSGSKPFCSQGSCVACLNDAQCSDNKFCTGVETCSLGVCKPGFLDINDNVACTTDTCDEVNDKIVHIPFNTLCDNGLFCDGTGFCNATSGCSQINPPVCNDGIACSSDSCSEGASLIDNAGNCVFDKSLCACTQSSDCNDNNVCTDDSCTGQLTCQKAFNNNLCNDNLFCTENDKCSFGTCAGTLKNTSDSIFCTIDSCDEVNDKLLHVSNNSVCNDGKYCNGEETCDSLFGCKPGISPTEDDGVSCTLDVCNEASDSFNHILNNSVCDDKKFCTIDLCTSHDCSYTARDCDDGIAGTFDLCNETAKKCGHIVIVHDGDGDGVPDEFDKCQGTPLTIISAVNKFGCPMPIFTKFDIITDLANIDLGNVSDFEIGIEKYGKIKYTGNNLSLIPSLTGGGGKYNGSNFSRIDFDSNIELSQHKIELNSANIPNMNKSAGIIFFNISFISPKILRNGENCTECQITNWNRILSRLEFSIPHFTFYEVTEGYDSCGNSSCDAGETCFNCVVDCGNCPAPPGGGGSSGGGGGGGNPPLTKLNCLENWICGEWQDCVSGFRIRDCKDKNNCGSEENKPIAREQCEEERAEKSQSEITKAITNITSKFDPRVIFTIIIVIAATIAILFVILIFRAIEKRKIKKIKQKAKFIH